MGNSNDKQKKDYYPMMDHYASGAARRNSNRSSRRSSGAKSSKQVKDYVKNRRESLKSQRKRAISSGLLEKRNTPKRNRRQSGNRVPSRPLSSGRSERESNKYDGLGDINYHSTLMRKKAKSVRPRTNSLQLMHSKGEIMLDVSPPPPPPFEEDAPPAVPELSEEEEALLMKSHTQLSEIDMQFVDYTIIPILLRSKIDYTKANNFGRALKLKYSSAQVLKVASSPTQLFNALENENIVLTEDEKFSIIEDRYWQEGVTETRKGKRNSFVYHRPNDSKNFREKKKDEREPRESFNERLSQRKEFEEQPVLDENENKSFDVGALRRSLRIFNDEIMKSTEL